MGHFLKRGLLVSILLCVLLMITGCGDTSKKLSKKVRKKTDKIMQAIVEKDSAYLKSELCERFLYGESEKVDEDIETLMNVFDGEIMEYTFQKDGGETYGHSFGKTTYYRTMKEYVIYSANESAYRVVINYCFIDADGDDNEGVDLISVYEPEGQHIYGLYPAVDFGG